MKSLPVIAEREPLEVALARRTAPGALFEPHEGAPGRLRCTACAHRCVLEPGRTGACGVRRNEGGTGLVPFGYVARKYVRAVETNTIFHVRPGAKALTFGMFGCDLRCPYCHTWKISQALREGLPGEPVDVSAEAVARGAEEAGCEVVCAAYNEPMISAEWTATVFSEAKKRGMVTALVSDGNTTEEALAFMRPFADVFRVDLKGWSAEQYRVLGGRPGPVFDGIARARALGYWVEVVTLVVPGLNDDLPGLSALAARLAAIDPDLPFHLNAFYPRYKLEARPRTAPELLVAAAGSAYARGLRFVYVGNLAREMPELSHTRCPGCHAVAVRRENYRAVAISLEQGACASCGQALPGLWSRRPGAGEAGPGRRFVT